MGDGKLGLLTALVLHSSGLDVALVGKHQNKLALAQSQGVKTLLLNDLEIKKEWDVVVEATGSLSGFETSLSLTKPRGVLVLKSTIAASKEFNFSGIVVDEITVLGSRCGQFKPALRYLAEKKVDVKPLISNIFELDDAIKAFECNKNKESVKVLVRVE